MAIVDTRSPNRNYPVPTAPNWIEDDMPRVATTVGMIDADIAALMTSVSHCSLIGHTHSISDVIGLSAALAGKVNTGTTYTLAGLSDVSVGSGATNKQVLKFVGTQWQPGSVDWSEITNPPNVTTVFGASGTTHSIGLVPDPGATAGTTKVLRENGTWSNIGLSDVPVFAASGTNHATGLVPDPGATAGTTKVLRENGTWANVSASDVVTALPPAIFRNRLRNATFAINQRGVSGTVTLSAGQYGHDGVKGGASGCTYTFSTSGLDTTISISAGSLILPVEASLIEGGSYVFWHAGTAQARVWQGTGTSGTGAYAAATTAAPLALTGLTATTQTNVEFSTGTVLRPQLEPGAIATAFERRPIAFELLLCQRYFWQQAANTLTLGGYSGANGIWMSVQMTHPVTMRATPTMTTSWSYSGVIGSGTFSYVSSNFFAVAGNTTGTGSYSQTNGAVVTASAEI